MMNIEPMRFECLLSFLAANLQIHFELWRVLTGNVADTAKIISIRRFAGMRFLH